MFFIKRTAILNRDKPFIFYLPYSYPVNNEKQILNITKVHYEPTNYYNYIKLFYPNQHEIEAEMDEIRVESFYKEGKLEGSCKYWYEDGRNYEESVYKNGKRVVAGFAGFEYS